MLVPPLSPSELREVTPSGHGASWPLLPRFPARWRLFDPPGFRAPVNQRSFSPCSSLPKACPFQAISAKAERHYSTRQQPVATKTERYGDFSSEEKLPIRPADCQTKSAYFRYMALTGKSRKIIRPASAQYFRGNTIPIITCLRRSIGFLMHFGSGKCYYYIYLRIGFKYRDPDRKIFTAPYLPVQGTRPFWCSSISAK